MDSINNTNNTSLPTRVPITMKKDGELDVPKNIIPSVTAARSIFDRYRNDQLPRNQLAAEIEGLLSGNPPYDPADLKEHNLEHITNFNNLDARSIFDRAALGFWNLYNEVEYIATFEVGGSSPEELEVAQVLNKNFNKVVRKWVNFKHVTCQLITQLLRVGVSPAFWPDENDWRWNVVDYSRFYVASLAPVNNEELSCMFVETIFTAQFLMSIYEKHKDTKGIESEDDESITPWNIEALENFFLYYGNSVSNRNGTVSFENFVDMQRHYQNNDLSWDNVFVDGFRIVSMFQKEFDGKISHMMFDRGYTGDNKFLFKVNNQYNSFDEAIVVFTSSPGETCIHSNRGVGHKIYGGAQAMMQMDCSVIDMAKFTSTPFLKSLPGGSRDAEQIRVYPGTPTWIGTNEFVQTNFGANIGQITSASQYLLQKLNYNAANSGDDPSSPDSDKGSLSPDQSRIKSFREFNVLKHNIQWFYMNFDQVIQNMVSKMLQSRPGCPGYEYAEEFYNLCIDDGVPEQILAMFFKVSKSKLSKINKKLPRGLEVKASRVAGDGSTAGMIMGLEAMASIMGDMGPRESLAWKQMFIRALFGEDYVKTFTQESQNVDEQAAGASVAGLENIAMKQGESPVFSKDNEHRSHISVHLALCNQIIQGVKQQQMDPIQADKVFTVTIPHIEEHFQVYSQSPFAQKFIQGVIGAWNEIKQYATLNRKNAAEQVTAEMRKRQEAQKQQEQVMSDAQRKDFVAQKDNERKDALAMSKETRADHVSMMKNENEKDKIKRAAENKRLAVSLDANNTAQKISLNNSNNSVTSKDSLSTVDDSALSDELNRLGGDRPAQNDFETN